ncbi:MAG: hypothetical protein ABL906_03765, partial [Sideroxydans sp.]
GIEGSLKKGSGRWSPSIWLEKTPKNLHEMSISSIKLSFPRKRESSVFIKKALSLLCKEIYFVDWIPAFAGMTE